MGILEHLSFADLVAMRKEIGDRINSCHHDRYLILNGKKKDGPNRDELLQMAKKYLEQLANIKNEIDRRLIYLSL